MGLVEQAMDRGYETGMYTARNILDQAREELDA